MKNRHTEIINGSIKNKMACSFAWGRDTFGKGVGKESSSWKYWALAAKVNTSIFKKLSESHAKDVASLTTTLQQQHLLVHFLCLKHFPRDFFCSFLVFSQPLSLHLSTAASTSWQGLQTLFLKMKATRQLQEICAKLQQFYLGWPCSKECREWAFSQMRCSTCCCWQQQQKNLY